MEITTIGLDLADSTFSVHSVDAPGISSSARLRSDRKSCRPSLSCRAAWPV